MDHIAGRDIGEGMGGAVRHQRMRFRIQRHPQAIQIQAGGLIPPRRNDLRRARPHAGADGHERKEP